MEAIGNFLSQNSAGISSLLGTGAQMYGQQNASEAVVNANQAAATTQQQYLGTAGSYYQPYLSAGANAAGALSSAEGLNGAAPNYSGFENMPGYQFAVQQGTQAINRQASAMGSAYTPNTAASVGQYVTGTAMQDYNTYIQQLQATAGMGATAANQIGNLTYNTGANISQLQANSGQSQAGMYTGMGQTVGGALGAGNPYDYYGPNGSGTGAGGGVAGLVGSGLKALGGWLGGGSNDPNAGLTQDQLDTINSTDFNTYGTPAASGWGGYSDNSNIDYSGYTGG